MPQRTEKTEPDAPPNWAVLPEKMFAGKLYDPFCEGVYLQGPIQFDFGAHIRMGRGSYANFNFVVLDENRVTIGPGCVVGAGSVVTRDIPADSLAAGNPCRVLRPITEADRMASHPERMA